MPRNLRFAGILVGALSIATAPAHASSNGSWRATERDSGCAIEHYLDGGEGGLLFSILRMPDVSYSMSGLAFERYTETGERPTRIEVHAGNRTLLLLGPPSEMAEAAKRWAGRHPIDEFLALVEGQGEFTVTVDGDERAIPLEGFSDVRAPYEKCFAAMGKSSGPKPPRLIAFEGIHQLGAAAGRQSLLSEVLGYTLRVDAEGKAVDCTLSRSFRRKAVTLSLCRPLMKHSRFEPARDAQGNPVEGEFSGEVDFRMWMKQDGHLEPRVR